MVSELSGAVGREAVLLFTVSVDEKVIMRGDVVCCGANLSVPDEYSIVGSFLKVSILGGSVDDGKV